jgi:hypothetical protein
MSANKMATLFRPVGLIEMGHIFDSEMKAFPPRLAEQPIFYPVLYKDYARQIAKDWNAPSEQSGFAGFVTEFYVPSDYLAQFPVKTVGGSVHQELWVLAERLADFNSHIAGRIQVVEAHCGKDYVGFIPEKFGLKGKNAVEQFQCLALTISYSGMDFICETAANAKSVFLNYPFWTARDFTDLGIPEPKKEQVLNAIEKLWSERFPMIPLCKRSI